jgi:hypothetical protein
MACRSDRYSGSTTRFRPWFNWAGLAGGSVNTYHEPRSLPDIVAVVQDAEAASLKVRAVGSGWAFEDNAYSPDVMVSLVGLQAVLDYVTNPVDGALLEPVTARGRTLVHVEAGMKVATLNAQLAMRGLAMPTLGGSNGQSIVGAISTSTHGGDFEEPPFCDLVHAVHLVGPGGQEYWIERASSPVTSSKRLGRVLPCPDTFIVRDDELLDAVVVGQGRFGIVYSVILETIPMHSLARERVMVPLPLVIARLSAGIAGGSFLDPLLASLPPPSAGLNAATVRPRAMDLLIDSRNPTDFHIVRRWLASGPDSGGSGGNAICDLGAVGVLAAGAAAITLFGMNPLFLDNPLRLKDPTRLPRLIAKRAELSLSARPDLMPGEALAMVSNAYWDFGITRVPDILSFAAYQLQLATQRGPSYSVMTGGPTYDADGRQLRHELHWCYRADSCEVMFDAADPRYLDLVVLLAQSAPRFRQAGYISVRYSHRARALLSMHNVGSQHAVSIEVSSFKSMRDGPAWIDFVLREAQARGGRPHWGQQNRPGPAQVAQLYGSLFDRWRAVLHGFSGNSALFSSAYTVARGLEPQGTRAISIEGTASELSSRVVAATSLLLAEEN